MRIKFHSYILHPINYGKLFESKFGMLLKPVYSIPIRILFYLFTAAYIIASWLLHIEVSRIVVGRYPEITGTFVPREHSVAFSFIVLFLLVIYFVVKAIRGERRNITFYYWFLYSVCLFVFYLFISLHQVEIIHLIQYSSIAYLLGLCFDPKREKFYFSEILFLGIVLGIIDELLQYYVVAPGHTYLDFNDFLVNAMGTLAGSLFYYGFRNPKIKINTKPIYKSKRILITTGIAVIISLLFIDGTLRITPPYPIKAGSYAIVENRLTVYMERKAGLLGTWQKHFVRGHYYTLTPAEGTITIIFLYLAFSTYDPRFLNLVRDGKYK